MIFYKSTYPQLYILQVCFIRSYIIAKLTINFRYTQLPPSVVYHEGEANVTAALSAPLLWQPRLCKKIDSFRLGFRMTNFTRSHTPQHAGSPPCCFECLRMRVARGRTDRPYINRKYFPFRRLSWLAPARQ